MHIHAQIYCLKGNAYVHVCAGMFCLDAYTYANEYFAPVAPLQPDCCAFALQSLCVCNFAVLSLQVRHAVALPVSCCTVAARSPRG